MYAYQMEVSAPVKNLTEKLLAKQELESVEQVITSLVNAIESRDFITGYHCERVASLSEAFGQFLNLSPRKIRDLKWGAYIHDVGKIGIPDSILMKPDKLTPEEYEIMKQHTLIGEQICQPIKLLKGTLPIIRNHHERWDGTGYPDGLKGRQIPELPQIFQFLDIYDALTSDRPYKKAFPKKEAIEILWEETNLGWRNPQLMEQFSKFILKIDN